MRAAFITTLKLLPIILLLAIGIAILDTRIFQASQILPCYPEQLDPGHVCLQQVLKEYPNKIIWIDARNQDDFERHTVTGAKVFSIRPNDSNFQDLLVAAMPDLMNAAAKGECIVVFCSSNCTAATVVANELKKPDFDIQAPIFILEGGWSELRKNPELVP